MIQRLSYFHRERIDIVGVVALVLTSMNAYAQAPYEVIDQLPAATVAAVFANDAGDVFDQADKTGLASAFNGEPYKAFRDAAANQGISADSLLDEIPIPWSDIRPLLEGRAASLAVVETAPDEVSIGILINTRDRTENWKTLIEAYTQTSKTNGAKVSQSSSEASSQWLVESSDGSARNYLVLYQDWILFASELPLVEIWADTSIQRLKGDVRINNTLGYIEQKNGADGDVWFFADPIALLGVLERQDDEDSAAQGGTFADRHGFDAVKAIGGKIKLLDGSFEVSYNAKVWIGDAQVEHGMKVVSWLPTANAVASDWVSARVSSHALLYWDLQAIIENIAPIVDEAIRETTGKSENSFDSILAGIEEDCDVNLNEDLIPLLGPRIESISILKDDGKKRVEQSIVGIQIKNPENSEDVADLLFDLFDADPSCTPIPVGGFPFELWKLGEGQRAGQIQFNTPGAMVAHGHLFFASNFRAIADYIAVPRIQPLNKQVRYSRVVEILDGAAGPTPGIRIASFPDRDFKNVYELLREGKTEGAESIYAQLAQMMIDNGEFDLPYELLPPFQAIEPALGPAGIQLNVVEDGWEVFGMNLTGDATPRTAE